MSSIPETLPDHQVLYHDLFWDVKIILSCSFYSWSGSCFPFVIESRNYHNLQTLHGLTHHYNLRNNFQSFHFHLQNVYQILCSYSHHSQILQKSLSLDLHPLCRSQFIICPFGISYYALPFEFINSLCLTSWKSFSFVVSPQNAESCILSS